MTTTKTFTFADQLQFDADSSASTYDANLEPLEEEFLPSAQLPMTATALAIAAVVVTAMVSAVLGWEYGLFLVVGFGAKMAFSRYEASQTSSFQIGMQSSPSAGR